MGVDVRACVDAVIAEVGREIVLGTPLGLGKPVLTLNEFWRRAVADPRLDLTILTALTLTRPRPRGEIERRLLGPIVERIFGGTPELEWIEARRADRLPKNVRIHEFYMQPGALLGSAAAQRDYVSSNYTHAARDALDRGVNVYAQMVGRRGSDPTSTLSLSSNPDLTLDLVPAMRRRAPRCAAIADVNTRLPFMRGDAEVPASFFDHVVEGDGHDFPLFGPPDEAVTTTDWMIAAHASALVKDGGTLQLGIGSLSTAVCHLLVLRHQDNPAWRALLEEAGVLRPHGSLIERIGGSGTFETGLYAASEMLVDGYLRLFRAGVLARRVWPSAALQRIANGGGSLGAPRRELLEALVADGEVSSPLAPRDLDLLVETGLVRGDLRLEDGELLLPDGRRVAADLREAGTLAALERGGLGERLRGARVAHAAFFLGPRRFYGELAALDDEQRELFEMTKVARVNQLSGGEELKRLQRRDARFVNTALFATLLGAAASDALEDGRVVSGVGGQHDLVTQAHQLEGGRSLILLRSTREHGGRVTSNIVFRYGHTTLPRHLRDLVVTEYGIADLRGRTDAECCAAMISVADSRFQPELSTQARAAGKLPGGWTVPEACRDNRPERLHAIVGAKRRAGLLPRFPSGSELEEREFVLARSLKATRARIGAGRPRIPGVLGLARILRPEPWTRPLLERVGLDRPRSARERWLRLAVLYSLVTEDGS
ncbi:MAG: acetyl-CoA hydrolase/transferase C-terminal domain-containing protein [Planctomycetota bacterium]